MKLCDFHGCFMYIFLLVFWFMCLQAQKYIISYYHSFSKDFLFNNGITSGLEGMRSTQRHLSRKLNKIFWSDIFAWHNIENEYLWGNFSNYQTIFGPNICSNDRPQWVVKYSRVVLCFKPYENNICLLLLTMLCFTIELLSLIPLLNIF